MLSAGCRRVIGQHHQVPCLDGRVGGEQQRHADVPRRQGLPGKRPAGVQRDELAEPQPVDQPQAGQAVRALRALGWPAEHQPPRHPGKAGNRAQVVAGRCGGGDDDGVAVLGCRGAAGDDSPLRADAGHAR